MQYEMLNDICKVSALQATTALSRFLQTPVGVKIKPISVESLHHLFANMNKQETIVSLFQAINGELQGGSFLLYPQASALLVCDMLFKRPEGSTKKITVDEESALSELANIVVGNFLTSFAQFMQVDSLMHHSAVFATGTYDSICEMKLPMLDKSLREEIVVLVSFGMEHINSHGYVVLVFEKEKINALLAELQNVNG